jgi:hypothetical protein
VALAWLMTNFGRRMPLALYMVAAASPIFLKGQVTVLVFAKVRRGEGGEAL